MRKKQLRAQVALLEADKLALEEVRDKLMVERDAWRNQAGSLQTKLHRAASVFGEAFVKGGQLPPPKGPRRPNRPKLTGTQVYEIRNRHRFNHESQAYLARQYGVHPATISRVVRGVYHR